jgi:hypothetical protein
VGCDGAWRDHRKGYRPTFICVVSDRFEQEIATATAGQADIGECMVLGLLSQNCLRDIPTMRNWCDQNPPGFNDLTAPHHIPTL